LSMNAKEQAPWETAAGCNGEAIFDHRIRPSGGNNA
jgi:hypothetical protein